MNQKIIFRFAVLIFSLLVVNSSTAQTSEASKALKLGDYEKALSLYEKQLSAEPYNLDAMYRMGVCHLMLHHDLQAMQLIEKSLDINPDLDTEHAYYWLGMAYKYTHQPDKAQKALSTHLEKNRASINQEEIKRLKKLIAEVEVAQKHLSETNDSFKVEGIDKLNSEEAEHNLCISPDESIIMYTSGKASSEVKIDKKVGYHFEQIYFAIKEPNGSFGKFKPLHFTDKKAEHSAIIQILANNDLLVFRREQNGNFYIARKNESGWGDLEPLKEINSRAIESHAFINDEGNRILFSSDRDSKNGSLDLFESRKLDDGSWSKPVALPKSINSEKYDEDFPYLSQDGNTLYFSSDGEGTMGGLDVFKSVWDQQKNSWRNPQHLGAPINSVADDFFFKQKNQEQPATFTSNRNGGKGKTDLYKVSSEQTTTTILPFSN